MSMMIETRRVRLRLARGGPPANTLAGVGRASTDGSSGSIPSAPSSKGARLLHRNYIVRPTIGTLMKCRWANPDNLKYTNVLYVHSSSMRDQALTCAFGRRGTRGSHPVSPGCRGTAWSETEMERDREVGCGSRDRHATIVDLALLMYTEYMCLSTRRVC